MIATARFRGKANSWILCATLLVAMPSFGQIPAGDIDLALEPVVSGLVSPVLVTHAGDGSGRLFVVDQIGIIWVVDDGLLSVFLDITDRVIPLNDAFDERGLLGLAFHPNYEANGRFFVRYSAPRIGDPTEPCSDPDGFIVGCHEAVLAEFSVSTSDPNLGDPSSEQILFTVDEPQFNHNGGDVKFGPDGYLYFALGDGGGAHDGLADMPPSHGPIGHGQNIETALGSMLRIDVDSGSPYAIPPDNPFVGGPGLDEIYAYGFRNPFRFSFDGDGTLYLGDVGQALYEEVDVVVNGGNYGWVIREGAHCFDPFDPVTPPATCSTAGLIDPIAEYEHIDGIAIVGGFVYRGSRFPEMFGKYVFGDFSRDFGPTGRLFYFDVSEPTPQIFEFLYGTGSDLGLFLKGLGRGEDGEIYACLGPILGPTGTQGQVVRLTSRREFIRGDVNGDGGRDLADVVFNLSFLFIEGPSFCRDAHDVNDDGALDLSDAIYDLNEQFQMGPAVPAPNPNCGLDPTADAVVGGDLGCETYDCP